MTRETIVLTVLVALSLGVLLKFTPRPQVREVFLSIITFQLISWPIGFMLTWFHAIEYPVRLFSYATNVDFVFDYLTCPILFGIFQVHYPQKLRLVNQGVHYLFFSATATGMQWWMEKHTDLVEYIHWDWYWTLLLSLGEYWLARRYVLWYLERWARHVGEE